MWSTWLDPARDPVVRGGGPLADLLIFLSSFFSMVVGTVAGVMTIDRKYLRAARNFEVAWLVVEAAEMIAVNSGLGYLIIDSRNAGNRYHLVVAGMLMIGVVGFLLDALMRGLERSTRCAGAPIAARARA
jgi:NitT/TauT family transport system permease protein